MALGTLISLSFRPEAPAEDVRRESKNLSLFKVIRPTETWFGTKTPSETIDRIVREAMEQLGMERDEPEEMATATSDGAMQFDAAPGLAFTKPLAASINGKSLHSPRWSAILLTMIAQVKAKGFEGDKLVRELAIPAKAELYEAEGFKYHPDLGISVRRQSASDCWKEVERLGQEVAHPGHCRVLAAAEPEGAIPRQDGHIAVTESVELV
jgi:hypothetical protein